MWNCKGRGGVPSALWNPSWYVQTEFHDDQQGPFLPNQECLSQRPGIGLCRNKMDCKKQKVLWKNGEFWRRLAVESFPKYCLLGFL